MGWRRAGSHEARAGVLVRTVLSFLPVSFLGPPVPGVAVLVGEADQGVVLSPVLVSLDVALLRDGRSPTQRRDRAGVQTVEGVVSGLSSGSLWTKVLLASMTPRHRGLLALDIALAASEVRDERVPTMRPCASHLSPHLTHDLEDGRLAACLDGHGVP